MQMPMLTHRRHRLRRRQHHPAPAAPALRCVARAYRSSPLDAAGPHDGGSEDDSKVERSHEVLVLHAHDTAQVLTQVLETIAVVLRKIVNGAAKRKSLLLRPAVGSRVILAVSGADVRQLASFEEES